MPDTDNVDLTLPEMVSKFQSRIPCVTGISYRHPTQADYIFARDTGALPPQTHLGECYDMPDDSIVMLVYPTGGSHYACIGAVIIDFVFPE